MRSARICWQEKHCGRSWSSDTLAGVKRGEYPKRRAAVQSRITPLRGGRLEMGERGGATGMIFRRTRDGAEVFIGGTNDAAVGDAILHAVNFALDLRDP